MKRTGNTSALRASLLEALPKIRRYAAGLTGNVHDGDDLMQATAERILKKGLPQDAHPLRYMYRVCRNLWIDEVRSRDVRKRISDQGLLDPGHTASSESVAGIEIGLRDVAEAMQALTDDQRAVLLLISVEGLSYREAAEVLMIPIGTVMSRLARARTTLANALDRQDGK